MVSGATAHLVTREMFVKLVSSSNYCIPVASYALVYA